MKPSAAGLGHVSEAWWGEVCKKMKNAIIFLDNSASECLHWNGGLERLVSAGAANVKEFSSFEVKICLFNLFKKNFLISYNTKVCFYFIFEI